jgi:hypothetical protein
MSEQDESPPRDRGRFVKGQRPPKGAKVPPGGGPWGTLEMQAELQGRHGSRAFRNLFRRKSIVVMQALQRVMLDPNAPPAVKVAAAQLILDRGWGRIEDKPARAAKTAPDKPKTEPPVIVINRVPRPPKPGDV